MMLSAKRLFMVSVAAGIALATTEPTQAGPWLDSILGRRQPAYPVGAPVPVNGQTAYAPGAGYVPPSYAPYAGNQLAGGYPSTAYPATQTAGYGSYNPNVPPTYNAPLLAPGFPQSVAGVLPTAGYDTQWGRTPVTYYRPVTAFDPRYGTTVTSLQPCTSYQYQAQRPPVIAPRPLLGDYGLQANKWPGITGPGYNPTGLAPAAAYAPAYQNIPAGGVPLAPMNSYPQVPAPVVANALPTYPITSNYYGNANYGASSFAAPYVTSLPATSWPTQPIGTGVVPSASWMPANASGNCVNGMCLQPNGTYAPAGAMSNPGLTAPNIPGAIVTPYGAPTYSSTPNGAANVYGGGTAPLVNPGMANPGLVNPGIVNPGNAVPILPNQQILPPQPNNGLVDPESMRQPTLGVGLGGGQAAAKPGPVKTGDNVERFPMVAIDRVPRAVETPVQTEPKRIDSFSLNRLSQDASNSYITPNQMMNSAPIPSTLPEQPMTGLKPLSAPSDFDSKPNFNPRLLDPEDRTAMERANRLSGSNIQTVSRIQLKEDDSMVIPAVSFSSPDGTKSKIQLISGAERIQDNFQPTTSAQKSASKQTDKSGFRPVSRNN